MVSPRCAQLFLGWAYDSGRGAPQIDDLARLYYRFAADKGIAEAQYFLGDMYRQGRGGSQDDVQAAKWFHLAADQGYASAQYFLGLMYGTGQGVPKDYVQAHRWFNLAADQGEEDGAKNRDLVAQLMTPEEITQAQELARNWKPKKHKIKEYRW